ncbi:MAG: hypothetical protein KDA36_09275 [Planctomycetaceae bacterium]|nr:hypothetical protein [Planctomycetaceae bacterium]MCA9098566.1 hypothetical protein [Planctomycetaceae bacterium]
MKQLTAPRTVHYHILRTCERLHLQPAQFTSLPYEQQLQLLAYNHLRLLEETTSP